MRKHVLAAVAAFSATLASPVAASQAAVCPTQFTEAVPTTINGTSLCRTAGEVPYGSTKFSYVRNGATVTPVRKNLTFWAYRPAESPTSPADGFATKNTKRPVIIWLHGGSFVTGSPTELEGYAKLVSSYGFVSVLPRYQLVNQNDLLNIGASTNLSVDSVSQATQRNIQTNVRYLRARATALGINPNAIYVAGVSAGGITTIRLTTRSQDHDRGDRDNLVNASGVPTGLAAPNQSIQSSTVNGGVAISAMECFPGHANTVRFFYDLAGVNWGNCSVDTNTTGDAPFWLFSGNHDQTISNGWVTGTCTAYAAKCQGTTIYARYNAPYFEGPNHSDGSWGTCKLTPTASAQTLGAWWVNGVDSFPGGDHFLSDVYSCDARSGVYPTGQPTPGLFNNLYGAKQYKTVALNTYQAIEPLASAAPIT